MELKRIDLSNVWQIVRLRVTEEQEKKGFVATNAESVIEAYAANNSGFVALPFGLYEDDTPVGFVMIGYGSIGDEDEPAIAGNSYCVWRFMIDARYQGRGLGRTALELVLNYIRTLPCGPADHVWLSYEPDNEAARSLYASFGFEETGETDGDEVVALRRI